MLGSLFVFGVTNSRDCYNKGGCDVNNGVGIFNIGANILPVNAKRVLIIYCMDAIPWLLQGKLYQMPYLNFHSMWWESAAMVEIFVKSGIIVDYADYSNLPSLEWEKYDYIIDLGYVMHKIPDIKGQKKIYYSTGQHWLTHNVGELSRIRDFYYRTGIYVDAERQIKPIYADDYADFMTYFGNEEMLKGYTTTCSKVLLNISALSPKVEIKKDFDLARNHFLWIGGGGAIHKGLDLVVEAFASMPELTLHIIGSHTTEKGFMNWFSTMLQNHPNIIHHGWLNIESEEFCNIARMCISIVYASVAEGGAGSVAQAIHYGLIPIVTKTSAVRSAHLGYEIKTDNTNEIISEIVNYVRNIHDLPESELKIMTDKVSSFATQYHTREAYTESFTNLINKLI